LALRGLELELVRGQITVLLGANGAGKSTTISLLTGLLPPTSGECEVLDLSATAEMAQIRQLLGVCPQANVLWPELTVLEHLELYAAVKGVPAQLAVGAAAAMAKAVGLTHRQIFIYFSFFSLSGGMKRKLCVGIALLGDSPFVILDEPSSGMDPASRR
ncbi:P-loop containing nucleoside triphosphate hydrolase protein, partial [Pavlovales sp. CCMP2436]